MFNPELLKYEETKHLYMYDGVWFPSVTQILKMTLKDISDFVDRDILERARKFGSRIHGLCEYFLQMGTLPDGMTEREVSYLKQFQLFLVENDIKCINTELRLANPGKRFAGTLDLVVRQGGRVRIYDIKTGSSLSKETALQLAGYRNLYKEFSGEDVEIAVIHLKEDSYKIKDNYIEQEPWLCEQFNKLITYVNALRDVRVVNQMYRGENINFYWLDKARKVG